MCEFTVNLVGKRKHNQLMSLALFVSSSQHPRRA